MVEVKPVFMEELEFEESKKSTYGNFCLYCPSKLTGK